MAAEITLDVSGRRSMVVIYSSESKGGIWSAQISIITHNLVVGRIIGKEDISLVEKFCISLRGMKITGLQKRETQNIYISVGTLLKEVSSEISMCCIKLTKSAEASAQPARMSWVVQRLVVLMQVHVLLKSPISPPVPQLTGQHYLSNSCLHISDKSWIRAKQHEQQ